MNLFVHVDKPGKVSVIIDGIEERFPLLSALVVFVQSAALLNKILMKNGTSV
jgi:hypothetical protein